MKRKDIVLYPLTFGEIGVKQQVKNILHYRKPHFWLIATVATAIVMIVVYLLANPPHHTMDTDVADNAPNYAFGETLFSHVLSSYFPNSQGMPYFCITKDKFGVVVDTKGTIDHQYKPFISKPILEEKEFSLSLWDATEPHVPSDQIQQIFEDYNTIKIMEVKNSDKSETGYYVIYADNDVLVSYQPGTIRSWIISLNPFLPLDDER